MSNKIIIIHPSDIVRMGISALIQKHLTRDLIVLESLNDLASYQKISRHNLLFITSPEQNKDQFLSHINIFRKQNRVKIVLCRDRENEGQGDEKADCCFYLHDSSDRIIRLLSECMEIKKQGAEKNNSSGLTVREIDVVKLVALGKTNKDIADALCISIHTVISHRKNITEKLGIKSISGLTVFAVLNNYIDTDSID